MARRRRHVEEHANHERWLISYADFITLLFAFFVVMYSISSINEGKYRVLSDSLMWAFRQTPKSMDPIQVGQPAKADIAPNRSFIQRPNVLDTPALELLPEDRGTRRGIDDASLMGRLADELRRQLSELMESGLVTVRFNHLWLEVEIKDSVLFRSGSAMLQPDAVPVLKAVADVLRDHPNSVRVEGFTDDRPIDTLLYPSNWELSTARASSVVRLLTRSGVGPERMSAQGFAEFRPVAGNDTPEGRALNRRVLLVVLADERLVNVIDARSAAMTTLDSDEGDGMDGGQFEPWSAPDTGDSSRGPEQTEPMMGASMPPAVWSEPPLVAPVTILPPVYVVPPLRPVDPASSLRDGFGGVR
ncbi:MAG: flagellar motor protein MotD [Gammaproteobacteria bacterium]|jgi:chemotaxis protein MotB|nr:flagellar motor protein MotD [Gammaproteobacteria bacterium]